MNHAGEPSCGKGTLVWYAKIISTPHGISSLYKQNVCLFLLHAKLALKCQEPHLLLHQLRKPIIK